jgi:4-alpha-glucanotransferase
MNDSDAGAGGARRLGVLQPLFSLRTQRGWGVGEIGDLGRFCRWSAAAGMQVVQLLPVNELTAGESSPYSAATAFALDPVYLSLDDVEDFAAAGGRAALPPADRTLIDLMAATDAVDWQQVRALKQRAIARAFDWFEQHDWQTNGSRRRELERFIEQSAAWLPDFALFRALHDQQQMAWWDWPEPLAVRDPIALVEARREHARAILRRCWVEWQLAQQWTRARRDAQAAGVALKGDLPFMVAGDSADVWARPREFRRDRSVGVPPDAFSASGQDWGLPAFDWDAMRARGFPWLEARAARAGALYDLFRVDHVIGLFRTWSRPLANGPSAMAAALPDDQAGAGGAAADVRQGPGFSPAAEPDQIALGETVLGIFKRHGQVVAEDLGWVPPFLPAALARLGIPGYRVMRWEKDSQGAFLDPATYPVLSVATTGTHDVEPIAVWYDALAEGEKRALHALPGLRHLAPGAFSTEVRDAVLQVCAGAGSSLVVLPFQDLFGARDRINVPGTVAATNWTTRMPVELSALENDADTRARLQHLAAATQRSPIRIVQRALSV